jgi:hypothetical protein
MEVMKMEEEDSGDRGMLPVVQIGPTQYVADLRLRQFRNVKNPHEGMDFDNEKGKRMCEQTAHAKHHFQAGDVVSGMSEPVADSRLESVEFYKTSGLKVLAEQKAMEPPPWLGVPPELETYRARGHRRLDARTYEAKCQRCIWGCKMAVEMIIDQWNPSVRRYRQETFGYGPKSCSWYKAGPTRKIPGRKGMTWEEEDWVDEDATAHRGMDE